MGSEQENDLLDLSCIADLELTVDGLSKAMDQLGREGAASEEEVNAFSECIEDLWIRIIALRRARHRARAAAQPGRGVLADFRQTIRMLEGDLAFARQREQLRPR